MRNCISSILYCQQGSSRNPWHQGWVQGRVGL